MPCAILAAIMNLRTTFTLMVTTLTSLALSQCTDSEIGDRCKWCGGSGGSYEYDDFSEMYGWKTCPFCNGSGEEDDD